MGLANIADSVYAFAGKGDENGIPTPAVYTVQTNKWQAFETPPTKIGPDIKLVAIGEYLYVLGGKADDSDGGYALRYQAIYMISIPIVP